MIFTVAFQPPCAILFLRANRRVYRNDYQHSRFDPGRSTHKRRPEPPSRPSECPHPRLARRDTLAPVYSHFRVPPAIRPRQTSCHQIETLKRSTKPPLPTPKPTTNASAQQRTHTPQLCTKRQCLLMQDCYREGVYQLSQEQEAQAALLEQTRLNAERLRIAEENVRLAQEEVESQKKRLAAEEAARAEAQKARELAAKSVPPLSPVQQHAQPPAAAKPPAAPPPRTAPVTQPPTQPTANGTSATKSTTAFANTGATSTIVTTPSVSTNTPAPQTASTPTPEVNAKRQRALQIHTNLKALRKDIDVQISQNPALKNRAGDLRRELRKCVGQLSADKKGNSAVVSISKRHAKRPSANIESGSKGVWCAQGRLGKPGGLTYDGPKPPHL